MKFIVAQSGARRGYAVPLILNRAGMLERFYTDICGSIGIGRLASVLRRLPRVGPQFAKLHGRHIPQEILDKTYTFDRPVVAHALRTAASRNGDAARAFHRQKRWGETFGNAMTSAGFGDATHIFSMLGEGAPFLSGAKRRGLAVVSEVYILLSTLRIVDAERQAFPGWEPREPAGTIEAIESFARETLLALSDYFVCPSEIVRDDLVQHWNVDASSTTVVPYGMDPRWLELEPRPTPGRILFVGTAELRKGIHCLAAAADRLHAAGYPYEFRVAGQVAESIARQPQCARLNFLGRVPRSHIQVEFQQADVFVLPSLAEGSAEVTYEALAAGLPVVTTRSSGSVVRDGLEGRIIPERDPEALAAAIREIVEDRPRRDAMAAAARLWAREYTWERYGERLIEALRCFNGDSA
jgi:glycosyltransferase involved in cell wall biosynthesis